MNTRDSNINRWHAAAEALTFDGRALIDGKRVDAVDGRTFESISPIDGKLLAHVARCGEHEVEVAVAAGRRAFDAGKWSHMPPAARKRIMVRFSELIAERGDELALTDTLDMGKPIGHCLTLDIPYTVECVRWYGEAIDKRYDEIAPTVSEALALITREPVGVVGAIVPWNYPMVMAMWKVAPALAAGNSIVLKPSEKSPLSALRLADIALEAGIPPGVFNVVPGFGQEAGTALALHMDVDCIAFTGSTRVGKQIVQYAGQSNLKRAWTELGGKSPNIIFADCPNFETAVLTAVGGMFYNQGESCNAPSRLYVERPLMDRFMARALELAPAFMPGDPLNESTAMGAIVDRVQMEAVLKRIASGVEAGARLVIGGRQVREETGGFYIEPTIFDQVTPQMEIAREEIFGPVLSVFAFDEFDEVIQQANDTAYGLHAGIWTSDLSKAHRAARALRAGTIHVNQYGQDDITVPFGGFKQSGNGRDKSLHAFDKYTEMKTTWISLA